MTPLPPLFHHAFEKPHPSTIHPFKKGIAMARLGNGLDTKDPFPPIELTTYQGETIRLPEFFGDNFGVVQFVRGNW